MLEECLRLLDSGSSLEDCLSRYPDAADDLRPFLELRASLTAATQLDPPAGAYEQGRSRLLSQLEAQPATRVSTSFWSEIAHFFSGDRRWGGGLARAAVGVVAVFVLGLGALGVSAAGGFEPARDALEPARDVLSRLRIISDDNETERDAQDERPTERQTDAPPNAEETRERVRDMATPTACRRLSDRPCVDAARPTPTPKRDTRATETPRKDARATATPVRDAPIRPIDRVATLERPLDVAPIDPPSDEPVATSPLDGDRSDAPLDDGSTDTRSGEADATIEPREGDLTDKEPVSARTPEAPAVDEGGAEEERSGATDALDGGSGDGERTDQR